MTAYHIHGPSLHAFATPRAKSVIAWIKGATEFAALIIFICGMGCFVGLVSYGIYSLT